MKPQWWSIITETQGEQIDDNNVMKVENVLRRFSDGGFTISYGGSLSCYDVPEDVDSEREARNKLTIWDQPTFYQEGPIHTNPASSQKRKKKSWWETLMQRSKGSRRRKPMAANPSSTRAFIPPPVPVDWSAVPFDLASMDADGYYIPTTATSPPLLSVSIYTPLSHFDPQELEFLLGSNSTNKTSTSIDNPDKATLILDLEASKFYIDTTGTLTVDEIREGLPWWYAGPKPLTFNWRSTTCTRCQWRRYTYQQ